MCRFVIIKTRHRLRSLTNVYVEKISKRPDCLRLIIIIINFIFISVSHNLLSEMFPCSNINTYIILHFQYLTGQKFGFQHTPHVAT
jgi:hypothetical protein